VRSLGLLLVCRLAAFLLPQKEPGWVSPMDELDPLLSAWLASFPADERRALLDRAQGAWKRAPLEWGQLWRFRTLAWLAAAERRCDVVETLAKRLPDARNYPERWTAVVTAARAGCTAPTP